MGSGAWTIMGFGMLLRVGDMSPGMGMPKFVIMGGGTIDPGIMGFGIPGKQPGTPTGIGIGKPGKPNL